jgi:hypothetical protein
MGELVRDFPRPFDQLAPTEQDAAIADYARAAGAAPSARLAHLLGRTVGGQTFMRVRRPAIPTVELALPYRKGCDFDPKVHDWAGVEIAMRQKANFEPVEQAIAEIRDPNGPEAEMGRREELHAGYQRWLAGEREKEAARQKREEDDRAEAKRRAKELEYDLWYSLAPQAQMLYALALAVEDGEPLPDALRSIAKAVGRDDARLNLPNRPWWGSARPERGRL